MLAVLDWELSTLGDPLADFTYHCMQWHMPHSDSGAGTGSLVGLDLKALGIPSLSDYVDAYVARTGLDPRPYLAVYSAYNFFRLAAILQGIVGRVRDGTATNENAPARAQMVRPLADNRLGVRARGGRKMRPVKTFALALGAGGARGLAHIAIVEALDEMGVKPVAIAGVSIGAVIGAGYAAGMSGRAMRRHLIALAHDRGEVLRRVMGARAVAWSEILSAGFGNPLVVDGAKFCEAFIADLVPQELCRPDDPADADRRRPAHARGARLHGRPAQARGRGLDGGAGPGAPDRA